MVREWCEVVVVCGGRVVVGGEKIVAGGGKVVVGGTSRYCIESFYRLQI